MSHVFPAFGEKRKKQKRFARFAAFALLFPRLQESPVVFEAVTGVPFLSTV
jgi:hypothetical protein